MIIGEDDLLKASIYALLKIIAKTTKDQIAISSQS